MPANRKALILVGPPGAGKGTIRKALEAAMSARSFSTGEYILELDRRRQLTREQKELYKSGHFFPDEMMIGLITNFVQNTDSNLIFDGFPRNLAQAVHFDRMMAELSVDFMALLLVAPKKTLVSRILGRRVCVVCNYPAKQEDLVCAQCSSADLEVRSTDDAQTARVRLKIYDNQTKPMISHYESAGKLAFIRSDTGIERVIARAKQKLSLRGFI